MTQRHRSPLDPKRTNIMDSSNSWEEPWEAIPDYAAAMTSLPPDSSQDLLQPATGSGLEHVDLAVAPVQRESLRLNRSRYCLKPEFCFILESLPSLDGATAVGK